jgi:hypothetical protein
MTGCVELAASEYLVVHSTNSNRKRKILFANRLRSKKHKFMTYRELNG